LLLEVKNLTVYYGMVQALDNISIEVGKGEIVALIGPNGAGKSTALKSICGILNETGGKIRGGDVIFKGECIKDVLAYKLVKKGISLVPEGRRIFPTMTVLENLEMGFYTKFSVSRNQLTERLNMVFNLFPVLKGRQKQRGGTLSSGEQQMLAIGRALMLRPELLLLDEPSLGLSPNYIEDVFEKIKEINKAGTTVLLVEQNVRMALNYANRGYVFQIGKIALEDQSKNLIKNEKVRKLFFGGQC